MPTFWDSLGVFAGVHLVPTLTLQKPQQYQSRGFFALR